MCFRAYLTRETPLITITALLQLDKKTNSNGKMGFLIFTQGPLSHVIDYNSGRDVGSITEDYVKI